MPNIGPMEIGVLAIVALLVFGPKRLPELGSSFGKSILGFGKGIRGEDGDPREIEIDHDKVNDGGAE